MGFVQADPIRAPARAQDLILRHRVKGYRAGDLERRYESLGVEEDFFVIYGFVTRQLEKLMHPRPPVDAASDGMPAWPADRLSRATELLAFVRESGAGHPRQVDEHFSHGNVRNYWGGLSKATTHLITQMHYCGMLRVVRRERGIRIFAAHEHGPLPDDGERLMRLDALVDAVVNVYAPLPAASLNELIRRLRCGAPRCLTMCDCLPRSIRWSGIAGDSNCYGTGSTASRRTHRHRSANLVTTRCRCSGVTGWWDGQTPRSMINWW